MAGQRTDVVMGMPITVAIVDPLAPASRIDQAFEYFREVDARFSTYREDSEISRVNAGLPQAEWSTEMREVLQLCDETRSATGGFFDPVHKGVLDPSGIVKGWAVRNAARTISNAGFANYYIEAGGDIQVSGVNEEGQVWRVGIRHPVEHGKIVKVIGMGAGGVATSGTYLRGQHVYNPKAPDTPILDVVSITVVGPDVYEADRFATAAFAMGAAGIGYIESLNGFEGYMIDAHDTATFTSGFARYVIS